MARARKPKGAKKPPTTVKKGKGRPKRPDASRDLPDPPGGSKGAGKTGGKTNAKLPGVVATKHEGRYWKLGTTPAEIFTDGRTLDLAIPEALEKGERLRLELSAGLKAALGGGGVALPIRSPTIDDLRGPLTKAHESPVPFRSFDYADEAADKQVYVEHQGWQSVPNPLLPGMLGNVVATRILAGVEVVATGHPTPMPGEYVESAQGVPLSLNNTNRPGG